MRSNTTLPKSKELRTTITALQELTAGYTSHDFAVRLWDGTLWGNAEHPRFTLVLKHPGALRANQVLLSKPHHGSSNLPLTREDWYL